jgi:hypothetical protein
MRTAMIYADGDSPLACTAEFVCQVMLEAGVRFLADHPGYDLDGDPAELSQVMREARGSLGISGGQYNTVINHLRVIRDSGYAWWLQELSKDRRPQEIFEFDGTLASIPRALPDTQGEHE